MARSRIPSILTPQGPLPGSAYWWRRISIGLVLVAVVILAVVVSRLGTGGSSNTAATASQTPAASSSVPVAPTSSPPSPTTTPVGSVTPTPTAIAAGPCALSAVTVVVATSARSYPSGTSVVFTTTISTTGPACVVTGGLQIVVTSGDDRVWSNTDCTPDSGGKDSLAAAGSLAAQRTWDRTRTKPACAAVNGTTAATAGTYRAVATWGGATSAPAVFSLT